jgi:hypothetical protein
MAGLTYQRRQKRGLALDAAPTTPTSVPPVQAVAVE